MAQIPLRNKKKEIIDYALTDIDCFDKVMKYKWCISKYKLKNKIYKRVVGNVDGKQINLSHYIYGKPSKRNIIDHINNNPLDNRLSNLRETTRKINSQNKEKTSKKTSSKYIGVCKVKDRWMCRSGGIHLGMFGNELDAGIMYDKYVYILHGKYASTNKLITYESVAQLTLEDIMTVKKKKKPSKQYILEQTM